MAFVDITDPKSVLGCGTLMLPYMRSTDPLPITNEVGLDLLSHTNAPVIIKRLLYLIEKTNRPEDFAETLSAMSTRREQPQEISNRLKRLGYPIEFDFSERHAKEYILRSSNTRQTAHLVPLDQNKHRVFVVFLRFDADEVSVVCRNETGQEGIPLFKRKRMFGVGELEIFHFARLLVVSNQIRFLFPDSCQI